MTTHLTLDLAALIPARLQACLVLGMDETCPCCGHHVRRAPVPVPPGLAPWEDVLVTSTASEGDLAMSIDRDLHWTVPVAGVIGWGMVDQRGNLLWYETLYQVIAPGETFRMTR